MLTITVPGSSANVGPGFDSVGIAVGRYLTLQVQKSNEWKFSHVSHEIPEVDFYYNHFIYKVAKQVADWHEVEMPPCHVEMSSEIPLARGLGSSASAIVAGIELANQLCHLQLSDDTKFTYAVKIEGHPDNVTPCLFGGFVVTVKTADEVFYKKLPTVNVDTIVYIPPFELKTSDAREVLPKVFPIDEATSASAISNMTLVSLVTGDYELAGKMMEKDMFHEPYRSTLIPQYGAIRMKAAKFGAYGTVISGAGPTMISFVPKGEGHSIAEKIKGTIPELETYEVILLTLDELGLRVDGELS